MPIIAKIQVVSVLYDSNRYKYRAHRPFVLGKISESDILKEAQEKYGGYTGKDIALMSRKINMQPKTVRRQIEKLREEDASFSNFKLFKENGLITASFSED